MIRPPPRSTPLYSSAASDVYKRQIQRGGQTEDCHHFRRHRDVKSRLPLNTLALLPYGNVSQSAVIQIHHTRPGHVLGVNVQIITLEQVIIENSRTQIVRHTDGVDVTREVEVYVLHGNYLCIPTTSCPTLDAERRSQRGLTQGSHNLLAQFG